MHDLTKEKMSTKGSSELSCLVCNLNVDIKSCINIYFTSIPPNGETLASFVLRVLRPNSLDFQSSYICLQCYNLFQMLEQAQSNVTNIRSEILKAYQSGEKRKQMKETINGAIETVLNEKNFNSDFAHEEKLEIANALCHIQDTSNLVPKLNEVRPQEIKTYIHGALIEDSLESLNVDLSLADKSRTSPELKIINTTETLSEAVNDERVFKNKETGNLNRQANPLTFIEYAQCQLCNRLFKSKKSFQLHLIKHGESRPYQCQKCKERFVSLNLANVHCAKVHPKEKNCIGLASEPCENEVVDFSDIDGSLSEDLFKEMDNKNDFHWNNSIDNENHSIDDKKNKLTQSALNSNSPENPTGTSKVNLKSRRESKYSQKPLKHTCLTCGKKWRTLAELKTHMNSHSNLRPFMCEKCGKAYKHKPALEVHIGMHNGINPFQCSFCKKCFTQKGALMRHLPIHTGETPYQCELCGKRFVHHTSYHMHALSHTGKKSYRCDVCDLALLSTSHLKRHMRVHTGEKPYSCSCGKRFAERYNLFAHQKTHDPLDMSAKEAKIVPYKCKQCNALFDKKENFEEHVRNNHNSTTEDSNAWIGHAVDVEPQQLIIGEATKFYTTQNQISKVDGENTVSVNRWGDINCSKSQNFGFFKDDSDK